MSSTSIWPRAFCYKKLTTTWHTYLRHFVHYDRILIRRHRIEIARDNKNRRRRAGKPPIRRSQIEQPSVTVASRARRATDVIANVCAKRCAPGIDKRSRIVKIVCPAQEHGSVQLVASEGRS